MTTAADIDALLAAPKTLGGEPRWARDDTSAVVKLVAPLSTAGVLGGLILHAHATLQTTPQRGGCALIYQDKPIQRLSILPDHAHHNPFRPSAPAELRGLTLPADASRLHAWTHNRAWPRVGGDNLPFAEPLSIEVASIAEGLTIFLALCGIECVLPPPPWEPRLL
ncbi:hypothetical protein JKL49_13365 [Phenylobacterium sp. 20VBR1]|uniref:Uncharacterized protein n=1 Tax=Phenylobacterium glaciei TaxID=2803784 RepID=A0A941D552_9CAUL|nr:hypothetical protein [Phenylobacterium glaciei]MBR7620378.1 hypothetical protein [Phenylobacterium glaciei]